MNRKSLLASSVLAVLIAAPAWATTATQSQLPADVPEDQQAIQDNAVQVERPIQQVQQGSSAEDSSQPPQALSGRTYAAGESAAEAPAKGAVMGEENSLYTLTPAELRKMQVLDPSGKEVGKIEAVVRSREQENIQAVITSGGILGIGANEVAVPIDALKLRDDHVELSTSKEILENREEYQPEQYVDLQPEDKPISEFSAFEAVPGQPGQDGTSPQATGEPGKQPAPADDLQD